MSVFRSAVVVALAAALPLVVPAPAGAHCDTVDGPVAADVRTALDTGRLDAVLKWVRPADEAEVREVFAQATAARKAGPPARLVADRLFLETVVRVHRAGEGAPYTGVKPSGAPVEPAALAADKALASGSADAMAKDLAAAVESGLRERFQRAAEAREHADHNVEAGRAYVAAYVEFVHYAERLRLAATTPAAHGGGGHEH